MGELLVSGRVLFFYFFENHLKDIVSSTELEMI